MAESYPASFLRRVAETALRIREPARRFAGSVRATVTLAAILVGAYNFIMGSVYLSQMWWYRYGVGGLITSSGSLAVIFGLGDVAMIFAIIRKKDVFLHWIVCAVLAIYFMFPGMALGVILFVAIYYPGYPIITWEILRIITFPLYMCLLYCLLVELREGSSSEKPDSAGWLKSNLANQEPSALAGDGLLLKGQKDGSAPATFAPSSCVTAAPVHTALRVTDPALASGPLSSSEA